MSTSVVRLICPNLRCRSVLAVPGTARGRMVRCRKCGSRVQVPETPGKKQPAASVNEPEPSSPGE